MKKILLFASAIAGMILAGSCQRETLEPEQMASTVKFTVEAPGAIDTKTIADGLNVDVVHYAVYKTNSDETHAIEVATERPLAQGFVPMSSKRANINFDLLQDQYYTIIFWAQVSQDENGQNNYYELGDLRAISMKKDAENNIVGNEEERAAFFAWYSFDTNEHKDHVVTLKRPFAQLNLLTTLESLKPVSTGQTSGYEVAIERSTVTVEGLTSTFYPYAKPVLENTQGNANETKETFTFTLEATPAVQGIGEGDNGDLLHVNGKAYHYVSMNYFFVPLDQYTVNISYVLDTDKGNVNHAIAAVPVKKNYRTNVIGNLLTKESKFEISVDAEFGGQNLVDVWDGREVSEPAIVDGKYVISTAAELAWLAAAVNGTLPPVAVNGVAQPTPKAQKFSGKTFVLAEDIDLANPSIEIPTTWTPIGVGNNRFEGTFDGQNHTIKNLVVKTEGTTHAGLFGRVQSGYVKNVKVVNANVQGHASAAVIVAHGVCAKIDNCHVENAVVVSTPYNKDEANNVGGIVGFLGADGGPAWVKGCTVKNADITAYRKVGGIAGVANQAAVVTGNSVENINVTADQTAEYKESKAADLGAIVGYKHAQATVSENTETNVQLVHKVKSVEELNAKVEDAHKTLGAGVYNLTQDVNIENKSVQVVEGEVVINGQGYKITSGSDGNYAIITKGEKGSLTINADLVANGGGYAVTDGADLTIAGGTVHVQTPYNGGGRYCLYMEGEGSVATINGGTFSFDTSKSTRRAYIYASAGTTVYVKGGRFGKPSTRSDYKAGIMGNGTVIITGGTFGFDPTKWLAEGYTVKKEGQNWVVVGPAENTEDFLAALSYAKPGDVIYVAKSVVLPSSFVTSTPGALTIQGVSEDAQVSFNTKAGGADGGLNCYADGMDLVFKNIKVVSPNTGTAYSGGFGRAKSVKFENCEYIGQYRAGSAPTQFIKCTIDPQTSYIYTDYVNVDFVECVFNCSEGKGIQVYNDGNSTNTTIKVKDCAFTAAKHGATWDGKPVTAIDINSNGEKFTVNIEGTTVAGFPEGLVSGESIFNIKGGAENVTVVVDGLEWIRKGAWRDADGNAVVYSGEALQYALDANMNIILGGDIAGDVVATQKAGVKVVINGNGKNYDGMITVDGKSATYTTAGLTVKNLTFNASSISGDACIRLGDGTNATRYTCNVTVENCTFAVPGAVGVKSYTGGDKNLTITGCTATTAAHSLLQAKGIDGILVEKCAINSKNGLNFNNSTNVLVDECNADVRGYAARFGEGSAANGGAEVYAISNSTLKSACDDGDAVIILRGTADNSTLTLTNTTLVGTTEIANNTNAQVIR